MPFPTENKMTVDMGVSRMAKLGIAILAGEDNSISRRLNSLNRC